MHNLFAGAFFLCLVVHTAWVVYFEAATTMRSSPPGVGWAAHAWQQLLAAAPRNKFKTLLGASLVAYTCAVVVILPTTPWEAVWYGLAQWFGVNESYMAEVLPNFANFPPEAMFPASAKGGRPGLTVSYA